MNNKEKRNADGKTDWIFCKEYTNRWGQRMVAADYGYQFWRFPVNSKRKG
ncbi:MAG: hypothetical protein H6Q65_1162 [Firmicutes bacterium]|nr:hypothetical protein [Bacillota bacterium]